MIFIKKSSRAVIGANPRKPGNLRKNGGHLRLKLGAPNIGVISITGFENHRRAARATALAIHFAPSTDLDETSKIAGREGWNVTRRYIFWRRRVRLLLCADAKRSRRNERYGFNATSKQVMGTLIFFAIHNDERNMNLKRDNSLRLN
jgi:hypothetical protein